MFSIICRIVRLIFRSMPVRPNSMITFICFDIVYMFETALMFAYRPSQLRSFGELRGWPWPLFPGPWALALVHWPLGTGPLGLGAWALAGPQREPRAFGALALGPWMPI